MEGSRVRRVLNAACVCAHTLKSPSRAPRPRRSHPAKVSAPEPLEVTHGVWPQQLHPDESA
eukprot:17481-Pleurochrysis_carterae.AAC.1